jgi:hypothetical protein
VFFCANVCVQAKNIRISNNRFIVNSDVLYLISDGKNRP